MSTVKDELVRIQADTDALVTLVESGTDISRDLSEDLSRFGTEVQSVLEDISRATDDTVRLLDDRLADLRDRCVSAIEATGALLYRGQQEQASKIGGAVFGAGVVGGLFSLLGTAIAGRFISNAIHDASENRPATPDELKEKALLLLIAKIQDERSYVPVKDIMERAAGANAIVTPEETRRMLVLLSADGALERHSDAEDASLRLNLRHPKTDVAARATLPPTLRPQEVVRLEFIDLGPAFGVSLSPREAQEVNHIKIIEVDKKLVVRVDYSSLGRWLYHDSEPCASREQAEAIRLLAHSRLRRARF